MSFMIFRTSSGICVAPRCWTVDVRPSFNESMSTAVPDYTHKPDGVPALRKLVKQIRLTELQDSYKVGVQAKSDKWFKHTSTATGVIAAGQSDAAETHYNAAMTAVLSNKLRQKGLAGVTDADFQAGVVAVGASGYSSRAQAKSGKFAKKFGPYASTINAVLPQLAPKGTDPNANIDNRVKPIANALHKQKLGIS